ncbi:MAG TPA: lysophospholipid acyltransferase family protein [Candidatus Limnocylindrales bacterium]|nr:lysophospholipid acyltransferase family protein [Candidatus Limnocylindrales bacterium]
MEVAQWQDKALCGPGSPDPRTTLRKVTDRAAYQALRGVWSVLESASLARARGGLERLADLFARADRNHRRVVEENLEIAFPSMDTVVRDSVVRATFQNWGRIIAEIAHCDDVLDAARLDPDWTSLRAAVAEGRASGRGLLLLTAHIGNFELLARIFGSLVAPVAVFHRSLGVAEIDRFVLSERERCGVTTLGRGGSVRDALRILAGGGCVAVPLDQNQRDGRGIFIDVLGHPACTSTMLARLSLATGAPVLPVFSVWQGDRTSPVLCELISPPEGRLGGGERESALRDLTERYGREVDRVVRRFPHQWNWAHRRWKTRPRPSTA